MIENVNYNTKRLLDVKELSKYIGWPVATIYSKKCRGNFPKESIVKFDNSNKLFFEKETIDAWIEQHKIYN